MGFRLQMPLDNCGGSIGITSDHVFYYGNAVAETGNNATTDVDVFDMLGARNNVTDAGTELLLITP